ncbi:MAG: TolC family protein, partial [Candidatus Aminicenantes bacterium]|nr:TolC family protein [Candidatus Aminicenantes bacterium]
MKGKNKKLRRSKSFRMVSVFVSIFVCVSSFFLLQAEELTLEHALAIAEKSSPYMKNAALRLEISEKNLWAEQAGMKSQFYLSITPISFSSQRLFDDFTSSFYIQENLKTEAQLSITQPIKWTDGTLTIVDRFIWQEASSSFTGSVPEANFGNSLYFTLSQPLFTFNRTKMRIKELELALEDSQLYYVIRRLEIEKQVTQQFLNLYYSRMSIQIALEEYQNATVSYNIIESKVRAGISAPEELYQAELTRDNSMASLENRKMQHENALDNFKILLGLPLEEMIDVSADILKKIVDVDLSWAIDHGLNNRMEIRQKEIEIQYALDNLVRAGAENEFKASVDLSFGLTGVDERFANIYDSPNNDKLIAVSLNIPVFDWGRRKHRLAASRAQVETVRLSASEEQKNIKY